jgi:uncharacterized protein (DUF58 family)
VKAPATYKYLPPAYADRLSAMGITVRRPVVGAQQGLHRSPNFGSSVEFAEYREYRPGDSPALIDWAVYARSDRYMVRRFQEETNLRAYILLDTSESLLYREDGPMTKMEYASFLAAGLMYVLVHQSDSVGLMTFDQKVQKVFPPVGSFEGLRPLLLHLETITPKGPSNIEAALHEAAEQIQARSLVILISDLLQNPAEILRGIQHLHHDGHDVTVFHVLDGGEMALPFDGLVELRELETGQKQVIEATEIRDAYSRSVEHYLETIRRGCTESFADYFMAETKVPVEEVLHRRATRK